MAWKSFPLAASFTRLITAPFVRKIEGVENLPPPPYIVASNHSSFLDGVILSTEFAWLEKRPLHMVAYDEPFAHPLLGWFLRSGRSIPFSRASVEGSQGMLRLALGYLKMGEAVGIFPEGHINLGRKLRRPRKGLALLALESGCPVVPVGLVGSGALLPPGTWKPRLRERITLRIGRPLHFTEEKKEYYSVTSPARKELISFLLASIMQEISELSGIAPPSAVGRGGREG